MTTEAWKQFLIQKITNEREYRTIEIYHPDFTDIIRLCSDYVDQTLRLENEAPRNGNSLVLFTAINLKITEPGESPNQSPSLTVNLGALGSDVQEQIDNITSEGYFTPIEVIYRRFYEGNTDGPELVYYLSAANLKFESYKGVAFTASDIDLANRPAGETYTTERFEGLIGI